MITLVKTEDVNLTDFNDFVELYTTKYGNAIQKQTINESRINFGCKGDVYRRYTFKNSKVKVSIKYTSYCKNANGSFSPDMIAIIYENLEIIEKNKEEFYKRMDMEKEKLEQEKEKSYAAPLSHKKRWGIRNLSSTFSS